MKLFSLLKNINCRVFGSVNIDIEGLYHNDKEVKANGLFFCISGQNNNGKDFVFNAIKNGAVAICTESEIPGVHACQIIVKNVREVMSLVAGNFYGKPAEKLKIIGVTGTNGKTTTTYMLSGILERLGHKTAIIGTNGVMLDGQKFETGMTTPDPIELHKFFLQMVKKDVEYVCMEVSAHSIALKKIAGILFDRMIFTNLTEDHLDFFLSIENYFNTKRAVFVKKYTKFAIINQDDFYGQKITESINLPKVTYSIYSKADFKAEEIQIRNFKQIFKVNGTEFESCFLGKFNVYNLLSCVGCLNSLGFDLWDISQVAKTLSEVPGRFNVRYKNGRIFVVDYAHTPDGLENVLRLCKEIETSGKVISVFGCGGNRETQKRKIMGEISSKNADFTIITSDNPRFEKRETIARDIESGISNKNYKVVLDRVKAIKEAYKISEPGDLILISGKGAENYIDEMGKKTSYSDLFEIEKLEEE